MDNYERNSMIRLKRSQSISSRGRKLLAALTASTALAAGTLGVLTATGAAGAAAPAVSPDTASSLYLAGYQVAPTGGLASASDTFTVPKISCPGKDIAEDATQYDGVYTDDVLNYAFVTTECTSSGPSYFFNFSTEAGSFDEPGAVPGDTVVASLFESGSATWAEIHDLTQNLYWVANNDVNEGETVVDVGTLNAIYEGLAVPTYTKVKFSKATVNGDYLGFENPTRYNTYKGSVLIVKTGALTTNATGSSFSTTFKHGI
jgi:hypothetical protein